MVAVCLARWAAAADSNGTFCARSAGRKAKTMRPRTGAAIMSILVALIFAFVSQAASAANDQAPASKSKRYPHRVQSNTIVSDPSVGASCAYDRAAGRCMIDL